MKGFSIALSLLFFCDPGFSAGVSVSAIPKTSAGQIKLLQPLTDAINAYVECGKSFDVVCMTKTLGKVKTEMIRLKRKNVQLGVDPEIMTQDQLASWLRGLYPNKTNDGGAQTKGITDLDPLEVAQLCIDIIRTGCAIAFPNVSFPEHDAADALTPPGRSQYEEHLDTLQLMPNLGITSGPPAH